MLNTYILQKERQLRRAERKGGGKGDEVILREGPSNYSQGCVSGGPGHRRRRERSYPSAPSAQPIE